MDKLKMFKGETYYAGQYSGTLYTSINEFYKANTEEDIYLRISEEPKETFIEASCLLSQQWDSDYLQQVQEDLWPLLVHIYMARNFILNAVQHSDIQAATIMGRTNWQERSSHKSEPGKFHVLRLKNALDTMPSLIQDTTMTQKMNNAHHRLSKYLQGLLDTGCLKKKWDLFYDQYLRQIKNKLLNIYLVLKVGSIALS